MASGDVAAAAAQGTMPLGSDDLAVIGTAPAAATQPEATSAGAPGKHPPQMGNVMASLLDILRTPGMGVGQPGGSAKQVTIAPQIERLGPEGQPSASRAGSGPCSSSGGGAVHMGHAGPDDEGSAGDHQDPSGYVVKNTFLEAVGEDGGEGSSTVPIHKGFQSEPAKKVSTKELLAEDKIWSANSGSGVSSIAGGDSNLDAVSAGPASEARRLSDPAAGYDAHAAASEVASEERASGNAGAQDGGEQSGEAC